MADVAARAGVSRPTVSLHRLRERLARQSRQAEHEGDRRAANRTRTVAQA